MLVCLVEWSNVYCCCSALTMYGGVQWILVQTSCWVWLKCCEHGVDGKTKWMLSRLYLNDIFSLQIGIGAYCWDKRKTKYIFSWFVGPGNSNTESEHLIFMGEKVKMRKMKKKCWRKSQTTCFSVCFGSWRLRPPYAIDFLLFLHLIQMN